MTKKRWRWLLMALLAIGMIGIVFYFLSDPKRRQWVGVPEYQPFGKYAEEPASPGSGPDNFEPKVIEPTASDSDSAIHGEISVSIAFRSSDAPETEKPHRDHPAVTTPPCDPAVLEAIGQALLTTFGPVCDPLLATASSSLREMDALCLVLLGSPTPLPEVKLLDLETRALASESSKTVVERIVASDSRLPIKGLRGGADVAAESEMQNLVRETQTLRDASLWNDSGAGGITSSASQLGSSSMTSSGPSALGGTSAPAAGSTLGGTTGMAKGALQSLPRGGH